VLPKIPLQQTNKSTTNLGITQDNPTRVKIAFHKAQATSMEKIHKLSFPLAHTSPIDYNDMPLPKVIHSRNLSKGGRSSNLGIQKILTQSHSLFSSLSPPSLSSSSGTCKSILLGPRSDSSSSSSTSTSCNPHSHWGSFLAVFVSNSEDSRLLKEHSCCRSVEAHVLSEAFVPIIRRRSKSLEVVV
jgi:hypothetical protein